MQLLRNNDSISYLFDHGEAFPVHYERCEQLDAVAFIPPDSSVLELGARLGIVSSVINQLLTDPTKHVCVEPDKRAIHFLEVNRERSNSSYQIFHGAVSKDKLKFVSVNHSISSYTSKIEGEDIETLSVPELEKRYNVLFDVLVVDIEGAFQNLIQEIDLSQFKLILLEEDAGERCNYNYCHKLLEEAGFIIAHRYHDELYRSVLVNTRSLPYDLEVKLGIVGLFGKLGYIVEENFVTNPLAISARPYSHLTIKPKKNIKIKGVLFPVSDISAQITYYIDGEEREEKELEAGSSHSLEIKSNTNQAPTGWEVEIV